MVENLYVTRDLTGGLHSLHGAEAMFHSVPAMRGLLLAVILVGTLISFASGLEFELLSAGKPFDQRTQRIEAESLSLLSIALSGLLSLLAFVCGKTALAERQTRLKAEEEAARDPLTGLPNRRVFERSLIKASEFPSALLLIDLDRFKQVNDMLGHAAGDALLVAVASRIRSAVSNIEDCARIGGDEFAVILREGNAREGSARALAGWLSRKIAEDVTHKGRCFSPSASIGVAFSGALSPAQWLEAADKDMYRSKAKRRLLEAA